MVFALLMVASETILRRVPMLKSSGQLKWRDPPKWWYFFWFPSKTTKKWAPPKKTSPHLGQNNTCLSLVKQVVFGSFQSGVLLSGFIGRAATQLNGSYRDLSRVNILTLQRCSTLVFFPLRGVPLFSLCGLKHHREAQGALPGK